jgi:MoaA/NifB/PqqE/SkfB family radical SAM enzyme
MIHGGLNIFLKTANGQLSYNQCCLSTKQVELGTTEKIWNDTTLTALREQNNNNIWDPGCWECERLENSGRTSFRTDMIDTFGTKRNLSGPQRIDLLFDRSCNLACMTCGPASSTLWEKQLRDNKLPVTQYINNPDGSLEQISNMLRSLDLSNLEIVQMCGGETLLGNTYWRAAELIAKLVPDAKNKVIIGFQTNGTQPIDEKYYKTIEKFKLVRFLVSIDGTHNRFEYLRWPATWSQVTDNIMQLRETVPVNTMFYVQEVTSCLTMFYYNEVRDWAKQNFSTNRLGDPTGHANQLAIHKHLDINNITNEYVNAIRNTEMFHLLKPNWTENPSAITETIGELDKFDAIRNQNWKKTFPEVAEFYSRYL